MQRPEERDGEEELDPGCGAGEWGRRRRDAELLVPALDDGFLVGFLDEQEGELGEDGEEYERPLGPAPAFADGDE